MGMKSGSSKIVFAVSFIPLLLCVGVGIFSAVFGTDADWFSSEKVYGWEAFRSDFIISALLLCIVPVLPACLIIQIMCLLRINEKIRRIPPKKYVLISAAVIVAICGAIALVIFWEPITSGIESQGEKISAKRMLKNAEETFTYNESTYYSSGVFGIDGVVHDTMLIDYDKYEVGFLYDGLGEFWKVRLEKTADYSYDLRKIREDYFVQADVPLNAPGKRLITFCESEGTTYRTVAMIMETEDGFYFADDIRDKNTGYKKANWFDRSDYYVGEGVRYSDL